MKLFAALFFTTAFVAAEEVTFPAPHDYLFTPPSVSVAATPFSLSRTLGDHMVLQRDTPSTVWGFAAPGTTVKTTFNSIQYTTTAGSDTIWRQSLPSTPATMTGTTITFSTSTGESGQLQDVLFGDVYICSGQSNMQFSLPATTNGTAEAANANNYPYIRHMTVGQGTSSKVPLNDLQTIERTWAVANASTVSGGGGFGYLSSVCYFFGKGIADGLGGKVPIGLVSSNWGGTPVEHWADPPAFKRCNRTDTDSTLFNAMINPFAVGPMALTGFTWYQGESNVPNDVAYSCLFPSMIQSWRTLFSNPTAYFGFIQLSTWCVTGDAIPRMRVAQMAAVTTQNAGYAVNADHGAGCNIHPPQKQNCGYRLANSALALQYKQPITWKSPSYASVSSTTANSATIKLNDVTPAGLLLRPSANEGTVNCTSSKGVCAWASLQFDDAAASWVNATLAISGDNQGVVLTAEAPSGSTKVVATSYGWGAVPFLTVYLADSDLDLPLMAWNQTV